MAPEQAHGRNSALDARADQYAHQGRRELVAFTRLSVLGWFYVAEVDAKSVLGAR